MRATVPIILATLSALALGHASVPLTVAPVGPPAGAGSTTSGPGQLEVFSALKARAAGDDPVWYQHSSYDLYDSHGRRLKHVYNVVGYYEQAPRLITLPAGKYVVKAQAKDYLWVEVPVVIQPGETTRIHLDDAWQPPPGTASTELVSVPAGYPVGWRAGSVNGTGE